MASGDSRQKFGDPCNTAIRFTLCCALLLPWIGEAGDWKVTPRLGVGTTVTDNVNQDPAGEQEWDWSLVADPGFSASRQGSRLRANVDYSLASRLSLISSRHEFRNQLLLAGNSELYPDRLFFDASLSIRPVANGNNRLGNDSLYGNGLTQSGSFQLNPYWIDDFGGYAESRVSYSYGNVLFGSSEASNSQIQTLTAELASGRRFTTLTWNLNYFGSWQDNFGGDDDGINGGTGSNREERVELSTSYALNRQWSLLGQAGYDNSDGSNTDFDNNNGGYAKAGLRWTPSRFFEASALYGVNSNEFSVRVAPTSRTTLEISRTQQDVGVDPGTRWFGSLTHRTRFVTWSASYSEEVTTSQQSVLSQPLFDNEGNVIATPGPGFSLDDREFLSKNFQSQVAYTRGRTRIALNTYDERRNYSDGSGDEHIYGGGVDISRRLAPRTNLLVGVQLERDEGGNSGNNGNDGNNGDGGNGSNWNASIGLDHRFRTDLTGSLFYYHYQSNGGTFDNGNNNDNVNNGDGYRENRIDARLQMTF